MKSFNTSILVLLLVSGLGIGSSFAQDGSKQVTAVVEGEVKTKLLVSPADVDKLPQTTVTQKDRADKEHVYTGVELGLVLKSAGVTLGEELKGENLTKYLLVEASDGYQVLFSLAELDPSFSSRKVILANRKDGALLAADEGPFHIIIEGERRKPRNARQVIAMRVKFAD